MNIITKMGKKMDYRLGGIMDGLEQLKVNNTLTRMGEGFIKNGGLDKP